MGFTGFYWVFLGFTSNRVKSAKKNNEKTVKLGFFQSVVVLLGFTEF